MRRGSSRADAYLILILHGAGCAPKPAAPPAALTELRRASAEPTTEERAPSSHFADGLPPGPCQQAVSCEETKAVMHPDLTIDGRALCFWEYDVRCACAKQLQIDDYQTCHKGYY